MDETFDSQPLSSRYQRIRSNNGYIHLKNGAIVVAHIIPTCIKNINLRDIAHLNQRRITPIIVNNTDLDILFTDNALVYYRDDTCYLAMLSDGKIETAYSNTAIFINNEIITYHLERALFHCIKRNLRFYEMQSSNQLNCPVQIFLALLNIKSFTLNKSHNRNPSNVNEMYFDNELINNFNETTINLAIHNLANKIWIGFGESQSIHFDNEHRFIE